MRDHYNSMTEILKRDQKEKDSFQHDFQSLLNENKRLSLENENYR